MCHLYKNLFIYDIFFKKDLTTRNCMLDEVVENNYRNICEGVYIHKKNTPTDKVVFIDVDDTLTDEFWPAFGKYVMHKTEKKYGLQSKEYQKAKQLEDDLLCITENAMNNASYNFEKSLRERTNKIIEYGVSTNDLKECAQELNVCTGVDKLFTYFKENNYTVILISGGLYKIVNEIVAIHKLDVYGIICNNFEVEQGKIIGVKVPVGRNKGKLALDMIDSIEKQIGPVTQTYGFGDGSNDIQLLDAVEYFFASPRAKPALIKKLKGFKNTYKLKECLGEAIPIIKKIKVKAKVA